MKLHAFDIPDSAPELAFWLEDQLTGLHLAELVAELSAVHSDTAREEVTLAAILGQNLPGVLKSGLTVVPPAVMRNLLRHPRCLLDLQEQILIEGSSYWDEVEQRTNAVRDRVHRNWQYVSRVLLEKGPPIAPGMSLPRSAEPVELPTVPERPGQSVSVPTGSGQSALPHGQRTGLKMLAAAAAALLIGFFLGDRFGFQSSQVASGWGWQRPGVFAPVGTQQDYLNHLADSAEEWFKQRPETPAALARRIAEFREGCTALLLAEHPPLTAETRAWLRERCGVWAGKLDTHRNGLEAGQPVQPIRDAADETVRKLIQALRTRAHEVVT